MGQWAMTFCERSVTTKTADCHISTSGCVISWRDGQKYLPGSHHSHPCHANIPCRHVLNRNSGCRVNGSQQINSDTNFIPDWDRISDQNAIRRKCHFTVYHAAWNIETPHHKDKTVSPMSYIHNGNAYTCKRRILYWNGPLYPWPI